MPFGPAPAEWLIDSPAQMPEVVAVPWPPQPPANASDFHALVAALQALDRWHRPLIHGDMVGKRLAAHELARDRFVIERSFAADKHGAIIPGFAWDRDRSSKIKARQEAFNELHASRMREVHGLPAPPLVLPRFLKETAYLPRQVEAQDQGEADEISPRKVRLTYNVHDTGWPINRTPKLAIAPLMEASREAAFELSTCSGKYGVKANYSAERLDEVVRAQSKARLTFFCFLS
jgi:hypothetical protein